MPESSTPNAREVVAQEVARHQWFRFHKHVRGDDGRVTGYDYLCGCGDHFMFGKAVTPASCPSSSETEWSPVPIDSWTQHAPEDCPYRRAALASVEGTET